MPADSRLQPQLNLPLSNPRRREQPLFRPGVDASPPPALFGGTQSRSSTRLSRPQVPPPPTCRARGWFAAHPPRRPRGLQVRARAPSRLATHAAAAQARARYLCRTATPPWTRDPPRLFHAHPLGPQRISSPQPAATRSPPSAGCGCGGSRAPRNCRQRQSHAVRTQRQPRARPTRLLILFPAWGAAKSRPTAAPPPFPIPPLHRPDWPVRVRASRRAAGPPCTRAAQKARGPPPRARARPGWRLRLAAI
mmetsp:Transcript_37393/g.93000  ORF Transcript_37393/g.93000 Transcript_37393/m.93000 type:complete len:250 (+) Transcript_37393:3173-3922(+)